MIRKIKNIFKIVPAIIAMLLLTAPILGNAAWVGNQNNETLFLSTDSGVYRANASFPINILINTHGQNVVVVAAYINYNPSLFQVTIDTTGSIFTTEAEKTVDTTNGVIKITRGIPTPGVNVTNGKVATINIIGLTDVTPSVDNFTFQFSAGATVDSNIILNDGLGTDIMSGADNGRYTIDGTSPPNVSGFTATAGSNQLSLSWTNPVSSDFAGVKILRKTGSFPTSVTDGTQVYDNNGTSYIDAGLTNGTTYYYKAFSRDVVLNYSSGAQVSAVPHDTTPPAQITTLSATPLTATTVRLNWTAVGDNGSIGTASSYDIRYSTAIITAGNFTSATQVSGAPTPKASGSAETMTISGLLGNMTYYFAIKAIDGSANASVMSNVPSARTFRTADLNNDNIINSVDFGILMSYWNYTTRPAADINQDGIVNSVDFGIMMSQWG